MLGPYFTCNRFVTTNVEITSMQSQQPLNWYDACSNLYFNNLKNLHHHHHVHEGLGVFPVPWSSRWSWSLRLFLGRPLFLRPFGLYYSACFGILFVSILCACCSHFSWYCFISFTVFCAPVFFLMHWYNLNTHSLKSCLHYRWTDSVKEVFSLPRTRDYFFYAMLTVSFSVLKRWCWEHVLKLFA